MPRTKKDPIEEKKLIVRRKLLFFAAITAVIVVANAYLGLQGDSAGQDKQPDTSAQTQRAEREASDDNNLDSAAEILGSSTEKQRHIASEVVRGIDTTARRVDTQSRELVDETKAKVNESVSDFVYATTIKPIIDKFSALPADQQETVRSAICKQDGP